MKSIGLLAAVVCSMAHTIQAIEEHTFLQSSSPEEWEQAIRWTMSTNHVNAIRLFSKIVHKEKQNPDASPSELARYYILYNLAKLDRFSDVADQQNRLGSSRLPAPFQVNARRLLAESLLESGKFEKVLDVVHQSLTNDASEDGRLRLLQGRALAHLGMTSEAIDAISIGLFYGGDIPVDEKKKSVAVLLRILENQGRLAEAERLDRIFGSIWIERK